LQQELFANYQTDLGPRRAGELISQAVVGLLPNAGHTRRLKLRVVPLGEDGFGVDFAGWCVVVNFGQRELAGPIGPTQSMVPPQGVAVQPAFWP